MTQPAEQPGDDKRETQQGDGHLGRRRIGDIGQHAPECACTERDERCDVEEGTHFTTADFWR